MKTKNIAGMAGLRLGRKIALAERNAGRALHRRPLRWRRFTHWWRRREHFERRLEKLLYGPKGLKRGTPACP